MKLRTRNLLLASFAICFASGLIWLLSLALGQSSSGETSVPTDVPFIGAFLHDFKTTDTITYSCFQHPHGGGTCTITGGASRTIIADFCDASNISLTHGGTEIQDRYEILEFLSGRLSNMPDGLASEDSLVMYSYGNRFHKLYGVYDPPTQRYWIWLQFV